MNNTAIYNDNSAWFTVENIWKQPNIHQKEIGTITLDYCVANRTRDRSIAKMSYNVLLSK